MDLADHITRVLTPHLGANTADVVARHMLAKHGVAEGPVEPETARQLQETLRRGLVAFVGHEQAEQLAIRCVEPLPR